MMISASGSHNLPLKRANPTTIQNKFLVGYQGWFTCPGDGPPLDPGHHGWLHWFNYPVPDGGRPNTDLWPDVSAYSPSELFLAPGIKYANGDQAFLFSSRNAKTVQRHFHWMAEHGVDGAFLQRFAGQTDLEVGNQAIRDQRDEVGDRVREAAEKEGRVFAIMYDVSGVAPDRIQKIIEHDWMHLIHNKGVLDSPSYLRERGKAVVTLWGFGMADSHHDPTTVRAITAFIRNNTPGGAYIMAGTPAHWRTSVSDADPNPEFVNVWLEEFDAISPWTIGRYHNEESCDWFEKEKIKGDVELIDRHNEGWEPNKPGVRKVDYIPVVFPGGSGHNLSEGKWGWNDAPRNGGRFLWRQLFNVRRNGVRTIYGAMWDEYDEGTAYLPVVPHKSQVPITDKWRFMALDEDGYDLPSDWYMRICAFAAESLRGERIIHESFPVKELQDYWSNHPCYEDKDKSEAGPSGTAYENPALSSSLKAPATSYQDVPPPYSEENDNEGGSSEYLRGVPPTSPTLPAPSTRPDRNLLSSPESTSSASLERSSTQSLPQVRTNARSGIIHPSVIAQQSPTAESLTELFSKQSIGPEIHVDHKYYPSLPNHSSQQLHEVPHHQHYRPPSASPPGHNRSNSPHSRPPSGASYHGQRPWSGMPVPSHPHSPTRSEHDHHRRSSSSGYNPLYVPASSPPPLRPRPPASPEAHHHSFAGPDPSHQPRYGATSATSPFPQPFHGDPYHASGWPHPAGPPPVPPRPSGEDAYRSPPSTPYYPPPLGPPPQFAPPNGPPPVVYGEPYYAPRPPRPGSYPNPYPQSAPYPSSSNQEEDGPLQNIAHAGSRLWNKYLR